MLGEVAPGNLVRSSGLEAGDTVLLTKGVAVEGTAIIAREKEAILREQFGGEFLARCRGFLRDPGISIVREAHIAVETARIHAMHDPTEGGLATGLWEMALASGVGLEVYAEAIPIYEETRQLCRATGLDPMGVIASGALLIAVADVDVALVCGALEQANIAVAPIARALPSERAVELCTSRGRYPLRRFDQDEISRLF
jgi:hydrogenase maturation factor